MSDRLTILRSRGPRMCKLLKVDGTIEPYDRAKTFDWRSVEVDGIEALSALLTSLETDPRVCVIRGVPKTDAQPIRRLAENFADEPHRWLLIEVDEFEPLVSNAVTEPVDAALEYIHECLPSEFHDVSFHFQLSNSAGAPGKSHLLKIHLWFISEFAYDSVTLRAWAKALDLQLDRSVLQIVQPHFVSNPQREEGVVDPVPLRSGLVRCSRDSVPLVIDTEALNIRSASDRLRGDSLEADDPIADYTLRNWETWGTLPNGGVLVSCPWGDRHSGGAKGDTSSVLFPAGSNGYGSGAYVCLHAKCDDKHLSDFTAAIGYNPLAALAAPPEINGKHLNGELLPGFKRDGKGAIEPLYSNIHVALSSPQFVGCELTFDSFRSEIVMLESGSDEYRPFVDHDYSKIRLKLETSGFKPVKDSDVRSLVHLTAADNTFDSAAHWLNSLRWDGVSRVETFFIDYFGVEDSPYARACGLYAWTALAGRALDSGVQADMVPVLIGAQGLRKSRGVEAMAPMPSFATTMSFHEPEVERARKMRGTLVVELAELQGLKSREREEILAWITRSVEHWTPKYKEMSTTYGRRFICFATSNEDDFLDNPNGERRWLPLRVLKRVDTDGIAAVCEQLWAEGRDRYAVDGIAWQDAERLAMSVHSEFKSEDSWSDAVSTWLDHADMSGETPRGKAWLTLHEVAEGALSMPARTVKFGDQRRLGTVMRKLGFELSPRKVNGVSRKVWITVGNV